VGGGLPLGREASPAGVHSGPQNAGLLTENATPTSRIPLPATFQLEPGVFGGVESQLATNGTTVFAAVNNLAVPMSVKGVTESSPAPSALSRCQGRQTRRCRRPRLAAVLHPCARGPAAELEGVGGGVLGGGPVGIGSVLLDEVSMKAAATSLAASTVA
jgi:hypothetical protein